jgi:ribonuclease HI
MPLTLYFDGACEPRNPGGVATYGWLLVDGRRTIQTGWGFARKGRGATNNYAEWCALGFALRWLLDNRDRWEGQIEIRGDSQLVINQLTGAWQCRQPSLQRLRLRCLHILQELGIGWRAKWIPRERNTRADALSRRAYEDHTKKPVPERRRK